MDKISLLLYGWEILSSKLFSELLNMQFNKPSGSLMNLLCNYSIYGSAILVVSMINILWLTTASILPVHIFI